MEPKDIIKRAREVKGLTQSQLADIVGVSGRMIQRYEEGKYPKFKSEKIKKIDEALGIYVYDIIYDKKNETEGHKENEYLERFIEQIEARRRDAEALAKKMEDHYNDMKVALERSQLAINDFLKPMAISLKDIPPVLDTVARNSHEHDKEIMKALDHLLGNSPGTLEKESGKRILKGALEHQKKGKVDAGKTGK
jgi:transcriptional regulator with XRE-family HTH domain